MHEFEIRGSALEGFWFRCDCEVEGQIYDFVVAAEMEGSVHVAVNAL